VAKCESERVQAVCANVSFDCAPSQWRSLITWHGRLTGDFAIKGGLITPLLPLPTFPFTSPNICSAFFAKFSICTNNSCCCLLFLYAGTQTHFRVALGFCLDNNIIEYFSRIMDRTGPLTGCSQKYYFELLPSKLTQLEWKLLQPSHIAALSIFICY